MHVLVQQHAKNQRERISAQQLVGSPVLSNAESGHPGDPAAWTAVMRGRRSLHGLVLLTRQLPSQCGPSLRMNGGPPAQGVAVGE